MQGAIEIAADLPMNAYAVGARFNKDRSVRVRILNHEVMIQLDARELPEGFSNWGPHRKVRDEMAVHDVHVEHLDTGFLHFANFLTEAGKIGSEDGGNNLEHVNYSSRMPLAHFLLASAPPIHTGRIPHRIAAAHNIIAEPAGTY
jgi:hypothetical protein